MQAVGDAMESQGWRFLVGLVFLLALPAAGQEATSGQLSVDLSYFNANKPTKSTAGLHSRYNFSFLDRHLKKTHLNLDLNAEYGNAGPVDFKRYQAMIGPQFSRRLERFNLYGHTLAGATYIRLNEVFLRRDDTPLGLQTATVTGPSFGLGCGVEMDVNDRVKIRAVQVDIVPTRVFGQWTTDTRLRFGLVLKLTQ